MIGKLRCFGAAKNPIFETIPVYSICIWLNHNIIKKILRENHGINDR
jgi:hypothetical protein